MQAYKKSRFSTNISLYLGNDTRERERALVTIYGTWMGKTVPKLSNCTSFNNLEWPSVTWRNIQWPSVHKFGVTVPHLRCDWFTSFKVKRSKVKVTRPINAHTHRAPYLPNGKAYELQTWYTHEASRSLSATAELLFFINILHSDNFVWSS